MVAVKISVYFWRGHRRVRIGLWRSRSSILKHQRSNTGPRLVTNECDKTHCERIVSSDYSQNNFQYSSYVYVPGQATTLPGGGAGPACADVCSTDNEPVSSPEDQGWTGLPWCHTNIAETPWAYCFPSNAPPCDYELGYVPSSGDFTRCSLNCPSGYNGYQIATCNKKNDPLVWPTSPTSNNLCTPILCNAYSLPSQFVRSVRARSARISMISLFFFMSLKSQEYHSYRSLIL